MAVVADDGVVDGMAVLVVVGSNGSCCSCCVACRCVRENTPVHRVSTADMSGASTSNRRGDGGDVKMKASKEERGG